jgi:hypothetical protein
VSKTGRKVVAVPIGKVVVIVHSEAPHMVSVKVIVYFDPPCCPEPRPFAGIGYGNGAYGSWYEGLDPEVEPAVEVLPGEEDAEDIIAEVVFVCGGEGAGVGEGDSVTMITGVDLALEETGGSAGC